MDNDPVPTPGSLFRRGRRAARLRQIFLLIVLAAGLAFDLSIALYLNNAPPGGDAKIYSRIAVNLIDHGVFSADEQPADDGQFRPTLIRLPGYPLFIAAIYSIAGKENYSAVKAVQGLLHFAAAVLAALIAFYWVGGRRRRRRLAAFWTFVLAAFCPFTANYSALLLTEVPTIFLMAAMMLTGMLAIRAVSFKRSLLWWALTGAIGGLVVELRPDSGLFALGLGLTMVAAELTRLGVRKAIFPTLEKGLALTFVFCLVLLPWAIRNQRVFGQFQPLAPQHAADAGEFVPKGYYHWLRTWVNDFKYVGPTQWDLELYRIDVSKLPVSAFTDDAERARVTALIDQYNNSDPDHPLVPKKASADSEDNDDNSADSDSSDDNNDESADDNDDQDHDQDNDEANGELNLKITPDVDAQFEEIAEQRIKNEPARYYIVLPAERAVTMWFDNHADFYPFTGALLPLTDLDTDIHQDIWLPLFFAIDLVYTLIAIVGILLLGFSRWPRSRIWVLMALLMAVPRIAFFSTLENPEPRYLIELFFIAAVLGGIALSRIQFIRGSGKVGLTITYGRDRSKPA